MALAKRLVVCAGLSMLTGGHSAAATTPADLGVGVRTVRFLEDPPKDKVPVAVVYDGQSKESSDDAQAILAWLQANRSVLGAEIEPGLVDVRNLTGLSVPRGVAIVAAHTDQRFFDAIFDYARRTGALTMSADLACVNAGRCTVGMRAGDSVVVLVNHQVMKDCGTRFKQGFLMMVKGID
jgi:hypothetical protein